MPIKPENKARYPADWKAIRTAILARAGDRCEGCNVANYAWRENAAGRAVQVVLTIAHLDHTPENNAHDNLRALCQRCHNRYDQAHRQANAKATREGKNPNLSLDLPVGASQDDWIAQLAADAEKKA